ncbi:MAG: SIR2 family NAD-dependent protein deacylase, partial [Actinomycetota bacterium]
MRYSCRMEEVTTAIERIAGWVRAARHVTALTGAGISTESGIPDFRGPQGVWTRDPKSEKLSHISHYLADPEVRRATWQGRLHHPAWHAHPNSGHLALAELERKGRLHTLVTQNIDGLHQLAGSSPGLLIEIHGTIRE